MKLIVYTQVRENYAAHAGFTGEFYWKSKGGNEYEVGSFDVVDVERIQNLVEQAHVRIDRRDNYFEEYVISWDIIGDDELADFEKVQMEYEGKIAYPRSIITL